MVVSLVKESKPPCKVKHTKRGRKPVHSWEKLVSVCLLMIVLGYTFRDMQNEVPKLNLPWNEPYPDHYDSQGVPGDTGGIPRYAPRQDGSALHRGGKLDQRRSGIGQLRSGD